MHKDIEKFTPAALGQSADRSQIIAWLETFEPRLSGIFNLESGWDGRHSKPVNIDDLKKLLETLYNFELPEGLPAAQLVPLNGGGVQAEWPFGDLSIEIGVSNGEVYAFPGDESDPDGLTALSDSTIGMLREVFSAMQAATSARNPKIIDGTAETPALE